MRSPFARKGGGFAEHVVQRGAGRAACFSGAPDCLRYLALLRELAPTLECRIHAYALMSNHVHLLLTASGAGTAEGLMQALRVEYVSGSRYASRGADEGRAGMCFEEGCASSPIHSARHLLACMRYIELNPVRAGMVRRPEAYRWSSYAANAAGREDSLLSPHPHYLALGRDPDQRRAAYRRSVEVLLRPARVARPDSDR